MKRKKSSPIYKFIIFFIILFFIMPLMFMFMIAGSSGQQVPPPTSYEKAEEYKAVASECGIDWAQLIIYDFIRFDDLEDIDPNKTALDFYVVTYTESEYSEKDGWKDVVKIDYEGQEKIEKFFNENLISGEVNVSNFFDGIRRLQEELDKKSTETKKYSVSTRIKSFEEMVSIFGENDKQLAIDMYEEGVIPEMYGDDFDITYPNPGGNGQVNPGTGGNTGGNLPPIVIGDFTRADVINVAKSILGHPYLLGSKYPKKGKPDKPLDCSGFTDWVYIQLTGKGVGAGTAGQFANTKAISYGELKPGDLGFYRLPEEVNPPKTYNHVGIYVGKMNGKDVFIHCGGKAWKGPGTPNGRVVMTYNNCHEKLDGNFASKFVYYRRINVKYKGD